ncbi:MAG TPA: amidoligase family protein [Tepidisphaeraceae bacterium]|nr:amidoligase family protein [Tepidisphaeraceae bacterium]
MNGGSSADFLPPPVLHNARGDVRKAGFELEYSGLSITDSALLVRAVFGGGHVIDSTFEQRVTDTTFGDFKIEIDTKFLKDKQYEAPLRALGFDPDSTDTTRLERALLGVLSTVVPIEIGAPPIPVNQLAPLDELRRRLHLAGAKGTRASVFYAFGMHINPEIASEDPAVLLDHLRAFLLLYPWLKRESEVDLTRSITPYIDRFPSEYARLILRPDYPATPQRLIDDFLQHNPTRNRPLDMLPLLTHLDAERVRRAVPDMSLVTPRPSFHYRLPNCMIDEPHWTLAAEWNRWVAIERLANDAQRIAEMARDYEASEARSFKPFHDDWPDVLEQHMKSA